MEEGQKRLAELWAMKSHSPHHHHQHNLPIHLDLQRQLQGNHIVVSPFRSRKREDYQSATEQEVLEADRQEDLNTALMVGNPVEAARISNDHQPEASYQQVQPSMVTNMVR